MCLQRGTRIPEPRPAHTQRLQSRPVACGRRRLPVPGNLPRGGGGRRLSHGLGRPRRAGPRADGNAHGPCRARPGLCGLAEHDLGRSRTRARPHGHRDPHRHPDHQPQYPDRSQGHPLAGKRHHPRHCFGAVPAPAGGGAGVRRPGHLRPGAGCLRRARAGAAQRGRRRPRLRPPGLARQGQTPAGGTAGGSPEPRPFHPCGSQPCGDPRHARSAASGGNLPSTGGRVRLPSGLGRLLPGRSGAGVQGDGLPRRRWGLQRVERRQRTP
ncbi:hypothetical protein D3C84_628380 [compost metagenome]